MAHFSFMTRARIGVLVSSQHHHTGRIENFCRLGLLMPLLWLWSMHWNFRKILLHPHASNHFYHEHTAGMFSFPFQLFSCEHYARGTWPMFGPLCGCHSTRNVAKRNAGAYLGWPGSECGRRVPWCCPQPWSRSWALPSCSRARQHPRHTAGPGAGSGREGSCWRTCRTAGGKGFVVSTENSINNRPGARLQIVGKEVLSPAWFGVQLFPKEPSNSCSSPRAFWPEINLKQGDSREQTQSEEKQMH